MRKKFDAFEMQLKDRWGVLQEDIKDIETSKIREEKNIVKEGVCDECGVFDILSKFNDGFFCSECIKLFNLKVKKNHKRHE